VFVTSGQTNGIWMRENEIGISCLFGHAHIQRGGSPTPTLSTAGGKGKEERKKLGTKTNETLFYSAFRQP
jgi:hypothetical protein